MALLQPQQETSRTASPLEVPAAPWAQPSLSPPWEERVFPTPRPRLLGWSPLCPPLSPPARAPPPSGLQLKMANPSAPWKPSCEFSSTSVLHHAWLVASAAFVSTGAIGDGLLQGGGARAAPSRQQAYPLRATRATLGPQPSLSLVPPEASPPRSATCGLGDCVPHGTLGTHQSMAGPRKKKHWASSPPLGADCPLGLSQGGRELGEGRKDSIHSWTRGRDHQGPTPRSCQVPLASAEGLEQVSLELIRSV